MHGAHYSRDEQKNRKDGQEERGPGYTLIERRVLFFLKDIKGSSLDEVESIEEALRQIRETEEQKQKKDT